MFGYTTTVFVGGVTDHGISQLFIGQSVYNGNATTGAAVGSQNPQTYVAVYQVQDPTSGDCNLDVWTGLGPPALSTPCPSGTALPAIPYVGF
jgi:hypothetical protein